jgi:DNA mismatch endonuclease (patch repair protein)
MLRKGLWHLGYRYRLYDAKLPGRPDIVFSKYRTAIFVDGDFWHGRILIDHGPEALKASFKTERREFWIAKIMKNISRDRRNDADLAALGYRVIRVWERDILRNSEYVIRDVERQLIGGIGRISESDDSPDCPSNPLQE